MPWYLKITLKILLILVLVICAHYLQSLSRRKDSNNMKKTNHKNQPSSKNVTVLHDENGHDEGIDTKSSQLKNYQTLQDYRKVQSSSPSQLCPMSFAITDVEQEWFNVSFEQISPLTNRANKSAKTHDDSTSPTVVIMTPISNVRDKLMHYFQMLCSLTYPHDKISVVLGEDSSHDQTLFEAKKISGMLRPYFRRIEVFHLNGNQPNSEGNYRHSKEYQRIRRKHLAMSRNQILSMGLKNEAWVLWLDADVRHIPADLIQHLMSAKKDIVTCNCLYKMSDGTMDTFDRNTWQETVESLFDLRGKPRDYLMLEGYGRSKRKFLNDLKSENNANVEAKNIERKNFEQSDEHLVNIYLTSSNNNVISGKLKNSSSHNNNNNNNNGLMVKLDGVGGCVLLVKAYLHLRGLNFPPYPFDHHIETEGFAKMATQVFGVQPYGLPWIHVIHW